jgi:hypothetical protein
MTNYLGNKEKLHTIPTILKTFILVQGIKRLFSKKKKKNLRVMLQQYLFDSKNKDNVN